jgi:hypothetical protein
MEIGTDEQTALKHSHIKFHKNSLIGSRVFTFGETDDQLDTTDMTTLIGALAILRRTYQVRSVCPVARKEQVENRWASFYDI